MNVAELKEMLNRYPDDMEVLTERYSDYQIINESEWSIVKAVNQGDYVMRTHFTMSKENKEKEQEYLLLLGN